METIHIIINVHLQCVCILINHILDFHNNYDYLFASAGNPYWDDKE